MGEKPGGAVESERRRHSLLRAAAWLAWCVSAAAAPLLAAAGFALLTHAQIRSGHLHEVLGTGVLAGMIVGLLAGLRMGRLWAFVLGPSLGFAAGHADLRAFAWICSCEGVPLRLAELLPVWGTLLGCFVAFPRRRWGTILIVIFSVALVDTGSRWLWLAWRLGDISWLPAGTGMDREAMELLGALVYAPPAMLVVALAPRLRARRPAGTQG
ncbi:MAG: hypothetical protein HYY93_14140 [Planctomycetes bacterium]|nr:hypothetical protein [Planctomycetota bacterium]